MGGRPVKTLTLGLLQDNIMEGTLGDKKYKKWCWQVEHDFDLICLDTEI